MIEAKEILYIVIAFGVLWVSAFVCWLVFNVVMFLRSVRAVLDEVKWQIGNVEQAIQAMKTKFEDGSGHLSKLSNNIKKAVDSMRKK